MHSTIQLAKLRRWFTPLEDLDIVANPEDNFVVIMKDDKIYKNMLRKPLSR